MNGGGSGSTRRGKVILIAAAILFAVWTLALLAMYFLTVYPQRYPHKTAPAAQLAG
jgi:hypothetical protein